MNKYELQESAGQSSIGLQVYVWDEEYKASSSAETAESKFVYLVPVTSDPPEMGSAPDTIEITEADSPVRQYVADRPDSPSLEFEYNFNTNGYNYNRVKQGTSATTAKIYCLLLPLGSAFLIKATGSTWMTGGNPIRGAFNLTQAEEAIFVSNLTSTFATLETAGELTLAKIQDWLGDDVIGSMALKDIIALDSMPTGRETDAVKEVTSESL